VLEHLLAGPELQPGPMEEDLVRQEADPP